MAAAENPAEGQEGREWSMGEVTRKSSPSSFDVYGIARIYVGICAVNERKKLPRAIILFLLFLLLPFDTANFRES